MQVPIQNGTLLRTPKNVEFFRNSTIIIDQVRMDMDEDYIGHEMAEVEFSDQMVSEDQKKYFSGSLSLWKR